MVRAPALAPLLAPDLLMTNFIMFDLELTDTEAAFFAAGRAYEQSTTESFADMDIGFEPPSFWQRLTRRDDER
jgi:hypothetical protein